MAAAQNCVSASQELDKIKSSNRKFSCRPAIWLKFYCVHKEINLPYLISFKGNPLLLSEIHLSLKEIHLFQKGNPFVFKGNPYISKGNPFICKGNPFTFEGNLLIFKRNPFIFEGNPFSFP